MPVANMNQGAAIAGLQAGPTKPLEQTGQTGSPDRRKILVCDEIIRRLQANAMVCRGGRRPHWAYRDLSCQKAEGKGRSSGSIRSGADHPDPDAAARSATKLLI